MKALLCSLVPAPVQPVEVVATLHLAAAAPHRCGRGEARIGSDSLTLVKYKFVQVHRKGGAMRTPLLVSVPLLLLLAAPGCGGTVWVHGERYVAERGMPIPDTGHWDAEGRCVFDDVGMSGDNVSFILDPTICTARVDEPGDAIPDDVSDTLPPVPSDPDPLPLVPASRKRHGTTNDALIPSPPVP
jgi:hypothetical protein